MEESSWNGLNFITDEIGQNRRTFESLNREYSERQNTKENTRRRNTRPFTDDYDFVRYQDRIKNNEELKNLKNVRLAKGIIALGMAFTLVLGGSCAGSVIADKFDNLFKGENLEQTGGTFYPSREAYEANITSDQMGEMQEEVEKAKQIYSELASGEKQNLTEEDINAIRAYPENQYGDINIPEAEETQINTFPKTKAM